MKDIIEVVLPSILANDGWSNKGNGITSLELLAKWKCWR